MSRARDSQRAKVYRWEKSIPGLQTGAWVAVPVRTYRTDDGETSVFYRQRCQIEDEMSMAECAALVARVWADYRPEVLRLPTVTPGSGARMASGWRDRINLPRWARQPAVILHEVAHSLQPLVRWIEPDGTTYLPDGTTYLPDGGEVVSLPWHGPEFVRLFIELLVRYHAPARGMRGVLLRTARAAKIKVGRLQDCPKPVRRNQTCSGRSSV